MSAQLFKEYSQFEDRLIREFHAHPLYRTFHKLSKEQFQNYLLQIGFIAQNFVKWYETAKLGMISESAKDVIRHILRDEIPQQGSTHQDDRLYDLNLIGVSTEHVRNVTPSAVTRRTIEHLYELVQYPQDEYDLRVMITLRVAGEVLVAEQYQHIVRYMRVNLGIQPSQSQFYFPHWKHDLKGAHTEDSAGHTDAFDELLESMLTDERKLEVAKDAARKAFEVRSGIHDQFVKKPARLLASVGCIVALLIIVGLYGPTVYHNATRQARFERFLASADPATRRAVLEWDISLLERIQRTGETDLLKKVGTWEAGFIQWGPGP